MTPGAGGEAVPNRRRAATLRMFPRTQVEGLHVLRRLLLLCGGFVAAGLIVGSLGATNSRAGAQATATEPVPSLTPVATEQLWTELVQRPRSQAVQAADCLPLRAVFYAATDWLRLTTRLAANASPCAQYYISVPPLSADKTQPRSDQAWRIRALGPAFHALAEINVTGWTAWVGSTGGTWYEAGVEARRRMAAAGYDVSAGDTWALNELSSAVRQGVGNARANMRAFLKGLYDGDGVLPVVRGTVFVAGIGQGTTDLSLYQARLQDWYEDAGFWSDLSLYASDWSQELYGDVRHYAVAGASRETRRDSLNEYLQHQASLASVAPAAAAAAREFLDATYSPLGNAAWQYDASFGWTNVPVELMQDYVSAQTYATRSAANSRFGFAWSPRNLAEVPAADFNAQTDALLVRLAAAIADSARSAGGGLRSRLVHRLPRRRRRNDCVADVRHLEAVRARVHDQPSDRLARVAVGADDGRAPDEQRDVVHGRDRVAGRAVVVLADRPVLHYQQRPVDDDTHDVDRLGPERDELLLPRRPEWHCDGFGGLGRQDVRHPDDHGRRAAGRDAATSRPSRTAGRPPADPAPADPGPAAGTQPVVTPVAHTGHRPARGLLPQRSVSSARCRPG